MKNIWTFTLFAVSAQLLAGAASSSSSSSSSSSIRSNLPYLDLLLNPEERLKSIRLHPQEFDDDYEKKDLMRYARKRFYPGNVHFLHGMLKRIEQGVSVSSVAEQIPEDERGKKFDIYINLLKELAKASDTYDAVRMLTAGALKDRLKPIGQPRIIQAFFSPFIVEKDDTKIEETIRWLIRSEQKSIKIAAYYFTNVSIMWELVNAMKRNVEVIIVINRDSPQVWLSRLYLPYYVWKSPMDSTLNMHHKFILFESNIDGDSILVDGSYNLTNFANKNHENIIVLNDKALFNQFVERFILVKQFSVYKPPLTSIIKQASPVSSHTVTHAAEKLPAALEAQREIQTVSALTDEQLTGISSAKRSRPD